MADEQSYRRYFGNEHEWKALINWHGQLQDRSRRKASEGSKSGPSQVAMRAELRRADTPEAVLMTQGYKNLLFSLPDYWMGKDRMLALAVVAGSLAWIEEHKPDASFAAQLAGSAGSNQAPVSASRFSQLQKSDDINVFFKRLTRTSKLIGKKANVLSMADGVSRWCMEHQGDIPVKPSNAINVIWAMDYYRQLAKTNKSK